MTTEWKTVSQDEFYRHIDTLGAANDPMPSTERRDVTLWRNLRGTNSRAVVGKSYPGWGSPSDPKKFEILVEQ